MLRILKQNDLAAAIALLLLTFVLKARYIWHPPSINEIEHFDRGMLFTYHGLTSFYKAHPSWYVFFSTFIFLGFAIFFNFIINREKFLPKKTYIPAMAFMLFTSFAPVLNVFSTAFISNIILFIAFAKMMQLYQIADPRRACFDVGLLVSVAALFYFPSILFFFLFLALLLLLRPFVLEENIAYLLGIATPIYISLAIMYLTGHWHDMDKLVYLHITPPLKTMSVVPLIALTIISMTMMVYGFYLVNQAGSKNAIAVRKKWNGVVLYLFFSMVIGVFSNVFPGVPWIMAITPISILLSQTFFNSKEKLNAFVFYFLLIAVMLVQWVAK